MNKSKKNSEDPKCVKLGVESGSASKQCRSSKKCKTLFILVKTATPFVEAKTTKNVEQQMRMPLKKLASFFLWLSVSQVSLQ